MSLTIPLIFPSLPVVAVPEGRSQKPWTTKIVYRQEIGICTKLHSCKLTISLFYGPWFVVGLWGYWRKKLWLLFLDPRADWNMGYFSSPATRSNYLDWCLIPEEKWSSRRSLWLCKRCLLMFTHFFTQFTNKSLTALVFKSGNPKQTHSPNSGFLCSKTVVNNWSKSRPKLHQCYEFITGGAIWLLFLQEHFMRFRTADWKHCAVFPCTCTPRIQCWHLDFLGKKKKQATIWTLYEMANQSFLVCVCVFFFCFFFAARCTTRNSGFPDVIHPRSNFAKKNNAKNIHFCFRREKIYTPLLSMQTSWNTNFPQQILRRDPPRIHKLHTLCLTRTFFFWKKKKKINKKGTKKAFFF